MTGNPGGPPEPAAPELDAVPPAMACAVELLDRLIRLGVRDFVLSPGSRSAPLALALAARERAGLVRLHVRIDERSGAFFAVGLIRGAGGPVAVACTSGSAVANLAPAVVEADHSGLPLLLLTADRPAELRGVGASQTIRQAGFFGDQVRLALDLPAPEAGDRFERDLWATSADRAVAAAVGQHGPVQLNLGFRPPLVGPVPEPAEPAAAQPAVVQSIPAPATGTGPELPRVTRGLVIVGDLPLPARAGAELGSQILALASDMGWPVLAEPTAGLPAHANLLDHGALIAGSARFCAANRPEFVLTVGRFGLNRDVPALVSSADEHWAVSVDGRGEPVDPTGSATRQLVALPTAGPMAGRSGGAWLEAWQAADRIAAGAVADLVTDSDSRTTGFAAEAPEPDAGASAPSGLAAALVVWDQLQVGDHMFLAASWPIRFIDFGAGARAGAGPGRVLANRGANGIDGLVSTAAGVATATTRSVAAGAAATGTDPDGRARTVALLGDVALLHDIGGLLAAAGPADHPADATIVVLDNDGGGIFSQLEQGQPAYEQDFERVFGTPHGRDIVAIAGAMGMMVTRVATLAELAGELVRSRRTPGVRVLVVPTRPRSEEAGQLRRLREMVADATADLVS